MDIVASHPDRLKEAALYFDACLPMLPLDDLDNQDVAFIAETVTGGFAPRTSAELLGRIRRFAIERKQRSVRAEDVLKIVPDEMQERVDNLLAAQFWAVAAFIVALSPSGKELAEKPEIKFAFDFLESCKSTLALERYPYLSPSSATDTIPKNEAPDEVEPMVTIANLRLVDTAPIPWSQIHELRRDQAAVAKLRRLRLFGIRSYAGKPRAFIEDDIAMRMEDYELEARRQGFALAQAAYSLVSESPAILAFAMALFGISAAPEIKALALSGAASIAVGKVVMSIGRAANERRSALVRHDAAYLYTLKAISPASTS